MIDSNDFVVKESYRKKARYLNEIIRAKLFHCFCSNCEQDRGYMPKSRYQNKPLCIKCATNTTEHKKKLCKNHWSKTKKYSPPKVYITDEQIEKKHQKELKHNREFYKKYYQKNKGSIHERRQHRMCSNVNVKLAAQLRTRTRNAIILGQKGGSAVKDLGCSISKLKIHLQLKFYRNPRDFHEYMSWDNWSRDGWHIDHIRPLASFDLSDPTQFKQACHYTNLRPLWARDNLIKGDKC